ncbi:MAG: site-specific DNA-methyltransferase [Verrucomicrobia bacterium]|nr:site-specific DNA-methyltransferase [Verrucomicrobiota bacterium]
MVGSGAGTFHIMATGDDLKLPLTSRDVHAERLAQFRALFPEAFTEGKADLQKLAQLLADAATDAPERYGLSWAGKSDALRAIQITSPGTLLPCPEESWPARPFAGAPNSPQGFGVRQSSAAFSPEADAASPKRQGTGAVQNAGATFETFSPLNTSENLIIEGDNLEVLKLLQGGYHGRVKMIYIDPPYNTGNEFIYPDNYKEGLADYLKFSGQVSGEGIRLTTNAETDGRYHSKWLTMMYPRLFLARNLLREDGVIFVSIDDHEVHNLRAVMNEIFGEENFVGVVVWKGATDNNPTQVAVEHEYVLCYCRDKANQPVWKNRTDDAKTILLREYGRLKAQFAAAPESIQQAIRAFIKSNREVLNGITHYDRVDERGVYTGSRKVHNPKPGGYFYDVIHPTIKKPCVPPVNGYRFPKTTMDSLLADKRIIFGDDETQIIQIKEYLESYEGKLSSVIHLDSRTGANELLDLFDVQKLFPNPKPSVLLKQLFDFLVRDDDLILDFFAGSGTTAQAVLELNAQDGGHRRFILVQLPEPTERPDFPTIADITKERVRRVIKKLEAESTAKSAESAKKSASELPLEDAESLRSLRSLRSNPDLGFKVFKLASSNFKVWDAASAPKDAAGLAEQLSLMAHNVVENRPDEALLYELILKSNLPLTSKVTAGQIGGQTFYDVADGTLAICLERPVTQETLRGLVARQPKSVICLDIAFAGNDQLKANTVLEMKSHGIEFHTA